MRGGLLRALLLFACREGRFLRNSLSTAGAGTAVAVKRLVPGSTAVVVPVCNCTRKLRTRMRLACCLTFRLAFL